MNASNMTGKSIRAMGIFRNEEASYSDVRRGLRRMKWEQKKS